MAMKLILATATASVSTFVLHGCKSAEKTTEEGVEKAIKVVEEHCEDAEKILNYYATDANKIAAEITAETITKEAGQQKFTQLMGKMMADTSDLAGNIFDDLAKKLPGDFFKKVADVYQDANSDDAKKKQKLEELEKKIKADFAAFYTGDKLKAVGTAVSNFLFVMDANKEHMNDTVAAMVEDVKTQFSKIPGVTIAANPKAPEVTDAPAPHSPDFKPFESLTDLVEIATKFIKKHELPSATDGDKKMFKFIGATQKPLFELLGGFTHWVAGMIRTVSKDQNGVEKFVAAIADLKSDDDYAKNLIAAIYDHFELETGDKSKKLKESLAEMLVELKKWKNLPENIKTLVDEAHTELTGKDSLKQALVVLVKVVTENKGAVVEALPSLGVFGI